MKRLRALIACTCLLLPGCTGDPGDPAGRVGLDDLERFGSLPYLSATRDPRLADELARIVEEGGTPAQLSAAAAAGEPSVGAALATLFPKERLGWLVARSAELLPPGEFRFDPIRLQHAIAFRRKYDQERLQAREALKRADRRLGICFLAGFAADTSVIDAARVCGRLEAFHAAELLAEDDLDGAIGVLDHMFALARCLAAEQHLDARIHAAQLRAEALAAMQTVATDGSVTREHLHALRQIVDAQLQAWPDDADAWLGERAIGLHAYELVRDGALLALLTEEEIEEFEQEGNLRMVAEAARRGADPDQLYYLETMREVIAVSQKPYHARLPALEAIDHDLQQRRETPDSPLVAARLLLKDLAAAHAIQGLDRALIEAWALALSAATGEPAAQSINPLTGWAYELAREDTLVVVSGIGAGSDAERWKVYVPDFTER